MTSLQRNPCALVIRSAAVATVFAALSLYAATGAAAEEACKLEGVEQRAFLPKTAAPANLRPMAKPGEPLPDDCGFYKWAWQAFLYETQATGGQAAFLGQPTFEDVFKIKESPLFADQRPNLLSLAREAPR